MSSSDIQFSGVEHEWASGMLRLCTSRIQHRGYQYYRAGFISGIQYHRKSGIIEANVQGTELYKVTIFPHEDEYDCDCPSQVFPCKHIAAVCHFITQNSESLESSDSTSFTHNRKKKSRQVFESEKIISYKQNELKWGLALSQYFGAISFIPLTKENVPIARNFFNQPYRMAAEQREFLRQNGIDSIDFSLTSAPAESQVISIIRAGFSDPKNPHKIPLFIEALGIYHEIIIDGELTLQVDYIFHKDKSLVTLLPYAVKDSVELYPGLILQKYFSFSIVCSSLKAYGITSPYSDNQLILQHLIEKTRKENLLFEYNEEKGGNKPEKYYLATAEKGTQSFPSSYLGLQPLAKIAANIHKIASWLPADFVQKFTNIFNSNPVLMLSVFHENDDREVEYKISLQYAYTKNNEIMEKLINSESEDIFFETEIATFPGIRHTHYNHEVDLLGLSFEGKLVIRNHREESYVRQKIRAPANIDENSGLIDFNGRDAEKWLLRNLPIFKEAGVLIRMRKDLAELFALKMYSFNLKIVSSSNINWFSAMFTIDGLTLEEQSEVLKQARSKSDFIKLSTGKWINLKVSGIQHSVETLELLGISPDAQGLIPYLSEGMVASLLLEKDLETRADKAVEKLRMRLVELQQPATQQKYHVSGHLKNILHDYQHEGFHFFARLYNFSLGGILADDMGLGKTLQTLAFLDAVYKKNRSVNFLIITPLAALSVWEIEAQKFTPNLPVHIWHGSDRKNRQIKPGILLTSFQTMVKDIKFLETLSFEIMILDEAQNAKNLQTGISKNLRKLQVRSTFCLTGTPIENRLDDLFSLFEVFFPGFLGSAKSFKKSSLSDKYDLPNLQKKIAPFILRRTKEKILTDLPAKKEFLLASGMTKEQTIIYEKARQKAEAALQNGEGTGIPLFEKLRHLMILRRIACHPYCSLSESDWQLSGKFLFFHEKIRQISQSANGILIFSQFTSVLGFIQKILEDTKIDFFYLDGQTPSKKRQEMTLAFQNGEKKAFLISLKAGGVALTLTRADTVIIMDPWWNPAVERQAIDRTHRIGQTRQVNIYRLITKATVEEKVIILQESKRELFHSVFDREGSYHRPITEKEINQLLL